MLTLSTIASWLLSNWNLSRLPCGNGCTSLHSATSIHTPLKLLLVVCEMKLLTSEIVELSLIGSNTWYWIQPSVLASISTQNGATTKPFLTKELAVGKSDGLFKGLNSSLNDMNPLLLTWDQKQTIVINLALCIHESVKKIKKILSKSKGCRVVKSTTGPQCKLTRNRHGMVTQLTC